MPRDLAGMGGSLILDGGGEGLWVDLEADALESGFGGEGAVGEGSEREAPAFEVFAVAAVAGEALDAVDEEAGGAGVGIEYELIVVPGGFGVGEREAWAIEGSADFGGEQGELMIRGVADEAKIIAVSGGGQFDTGASGALDGLHGRVEFPAFADGGVGLGAGELVVVVALFGGEQADRLVAGALRVHGHMFDDVEAGAETEIFEIPRGVVSDDGVVGGPAQMVKEPWSGDQQEEDGDGGGPEAGSGAGEAEFCFCLEFGGEGAGRRLAVFGAEREGAEDGTGSGGGDALVEAGGWEDFGGFLEFIETEGGIGFEGAVAGEHFVSDDAESVDVGGRAGLAHELFGGEVVDGADDGGGIGRGGGGLDFGDAEIDEFGGDVFAAGKEHDVFGFDVAVDDAGAMSGFEGVAEDGDDGGGFGEREGPGAEAGAEG